MAVKVTTGEQKPVIHSLSLVGSAGRHWMMCGIVFDKDGVQEISADQTIQEIESGQSIVCDRCALVENQGAHCATCGGVHALTSHIHAQVVV